MIDPACTTTVSIKPASGSSISLSHAPTVQNHQPFTDPAGSSVTVDFVEEQHSTPAVSPTSNSLPKMAANPETAHEMAASS